VRTTIALAAAIAALAGCSVDSYLTCGAPCEDGGASDATLLDSSGDAGTSDAPIDVTTTDSGCKGDGGYCQKSSECCSLSCNQSNRCTPSCSPAGGSCGSNGACCLGNFCSDGGCVACFQDYATCTSDTQCCGGNCNGGSDGGPKHCSGN
jgi:hypothetical protein